ncbi:MAG: hypothetical protein ABII07_04540 [Patescibacteria group bacterium]|nr:hypothetical protein [Patescibacteria group bacterium]
MQIRRTSKTAGISSSRVVDEVQPASGVRFEPDNDSKDIVCEVRDGEEGGPEGVAEEQDEFSYTEEALVAGRLERFRRRLLKAFIPDLLH